MVLPVRTVSKCLDSYTFWYLVLRGNNTEFRIGYIYLLHSRSIPLI